MTKLDAAVVPRLPRGVKFREDKVRGGYILLGPERIFNADEVARHILSRVDGATSLGAIVEDLATVFAADATVIRPDVEDFLIELRDKQMVLL